MATYKEIIPSDITTNKSQLNQLIDIVQEDVSGSTTRKKYAVFVTGGVGPGVTSSLFQTVFDQDFTLQTANPVFDFTVGLYYSGSTVQNCKTGEDTAGKLLFPSNSLMMREKVDIYSQYAQTLLGNANGAFFAPGIDQSTDTGDASSGQINEAMFVNFRRLFARDAIKRETFAMRFYTTGMLTSGQTAIFGTLGNQHNYQGKIPNVHVTSISGSKIFTDIGAASSQQVRHGGNVGQIVDSSDTSKKVGLMYYDHGVAVFDLAKICYKDQHMSGAIDAMRALSLIHI